MVKYLLFGLFCTVFFSYTSNFVFSEENTSNNPGFFLDSNKVSSGNFTQDQYTKLLEMSVVTLERTNNALTQRWTPFTVFLTILSTFFSLITIVWAVLFAFWFNQQSIIAKNIKESESMKETVKKIFEGIDKNVKGVDRKDLNEKNRASLEGIEILTGKGLSEISGSVPLSIFSNSKVNLTPGLHNIDVSDITNNGYQSVKINGVEVAKKKNS